MFECPIAVFMWAVVRDGLKWGNVPKSERFQEKKSSRLGVTKG
jgi:hypothetical protein